MRAIFNPVAPFYIKEKENDDDYLNEVDNYVEELWLQEKFEEALKKENKNAST